MQRIPTVGVGLALILLALTGCSTSAPVGPATVTVAPVPPGRPVHLYRILAGSDRYLVYATYPVRADGSAAATGTLRVRTADGRQTALGPVPKAGTTVHLAADMLLVSDGHIGSGWRWRNLRTGSSGTVPEARRPDLDQLQVTGIPAPAGTEVLDAVIGAAPDGWLVDQVPSSSGGDGRPGPPATLFVQKVDGSVTRLGAPRHYQVDWSVSTNDRVIVLAEYGNDERGGSTGGVTLARFDSPGSFDPLAAPVGANRFSLCSASSSRIACTVEGARGRTERLYTDDGALLLSTEPAPCLATPVPLGDALAWLEPSGKPCGGHLQVEYPGGQRRTLIGAFPDNVNSGPPVPAFGGVVIGQGFGGDVFDRLLSIDRDLRVRVLAG